ncbi:hypothetical protein BOTCAL_0635g00010 [Botryotinia calthae]|uniref:Uncharacterized protein n=1 Tax=Botryotinia calthae TaxID=38488 RepID=A0A4Y8CI43_9HELO|nr:hypothetical protein BOTCAL_0635g00010 [Botryotinia calthae]
MSFQQIPKDQSESPSIPPANSQANPEPPARLQTLPVEILGQICEDSMKEEEMGTNSGNITRKLPALVTSFKCGVNDQRRRAYIYLLDVCSRTFVYSIHFGNSWKLPMDSEEGGLVRNIVIKFVPGIRGHHPSDPWPFEIFRNSNVADTNPAARQSIIVKDEGYYCWNPMPEVVKSSLDNLPNLRLIQLEFKTFCSSFKLNSLGMSRLLQSLLDNHKDFKLTSATIELKGIKPREMTQRFMISQVTAMAGHEVSFDFTDKRIWELKAFTGKTDVRENTVNLDLEVNEYMRNPDLVEVLRGSKWTWVLEREEK